MRKNSHRLNLLLALRHFVCIYDITLTTYTTYSSPDQAFSCAFQLQSYHIITHWLENGWAKMRMLRYIRFFMFVTPLFCITRIAYFHSLCNAVFFRHNYFSFQQTSFRFNFIIHFPFHFHRILHCSSPLLPPLIHSQSLFISVALSVLLFLHVLFST